MSKANVSRYEQSKGNVRWNQVDALCRVYGVSDTERQELIDLAKNSKVKEGWWVPYHGRLSAPMQMLLPIENESSRIRQLATNVVPGLLQTLLYAQAIKTTPGKTLEPEDAGEFLDMRMYRQKILDRASPPDYHVLLDESVLRRAVGGPAVMAEQLDLLLERGQDSNVQIQVLPFGAGAYSAALSSFIVYGGPDPLLDVIFIENTVGSLFLEEEGAREAHVGGFDFLCREALDPDSSAELIAEARKTHLRNRN
ncbi:hypothetical protein C9F11_21085 [Streptomyces sp. YIM 121038]|nr:hypothetical protein C9F11_21085 [Streptomyces sp. YIM 121038]